MGVLTNIVAMCRRVCVGRTARLRPYLKRLVGEVGVDGFKSFIGKFYSSTMIFTTWERHVLINEFSLQVANLDTVQDRPKPAMRNGSAVADLLGYLDRLVTMDRFNRITAQCVTGGTGWLVFRLLRLGRGDGLGFWVDPSEPQQQAKIECATQPEAETEYCRGDWVVVSERKRAGSAEACANNRADKAEHQRRADSPAHGKFHITKIPKI